MKEEERREGGRGKGDDQAIEMSMIEDVRCPGESSPLNKRLCELRHWLSPHRVCYES